MNKRKVLLSLLLSLTCIGVLRHSDAVISTGGRASRASVGRDLTTETVLVSDAKSLNVTGCCNAQQVAYINAIIWQEAQTRNFLNWINEMRASKPPLLVKIMWCESARGKPKFTIDYKAENPESTASGGGQVLDGTWNGDPRRVIFGWKEFHPEAMKYTHAADAPDWLQDFVLIQAFHKFGTQPWEASEGCWSRA